MRRILITTGLLILLAQSYSLGVESALDWPVVQSGRVLVELRNSLDGQITRGADGLINTGLPALDTILAEVKADALDPFVPDYQLNRYLVSFSPEYTVEEVILKFESWSGIKEVWPCVLRPWTGFRYYPDDLLLPGQWHHDTIKAPEAWAITRGDASVQVGIIDGGVAYTHEDLAPNIWINPGEDLNGNRIIEPSEVDSTDNDANGYIDDFWGWDWINLDSTAVWPGEDYGPPDNDPSDFDGHGTHCAGDACAATNNSVGVASPGFNSQIMALRAGYLSITGQGYVDLTAAVSAVYYAVNMGAEVLSMSFGGSGIYTPFRDALSYASSQGLVLVGAAGNDSQPTIQYPAGYDWVIAVAATAPGDVLADFTNYGSWITLCAPGEAIKSTLIDGYGNMGGTSMATPIVAGAAAVVKSLVPNWSPDEIAIWLAYTCDNIDAQNPGYIGMMGGGRLNIAQAYDLHVAVDSVWADNGSGGTRLLYDREGQLFVQYHKYYGSASNVTLTVSSENPRVDFSQSSHTIGTISQGQVGNNLSEPFVLTVASGESIYETIEIEAHFSGDDLDFTQILEVPVGRPQILLIDADQNNEERIAAYYEEYLDGVGYTWETWKRSEMETLTTDINEYDAIIHFSGTAESNIFPGDDWQLLDDYLDDGGNLILTGQNVAEDLNNSQPDVLEDVLRVNYLEPHAGGLSVSGIETNPLTSGMNLVLAGTGGAWNQYSLDVVEALLGAQPLFIYNEGTPDELAGVRVRIGQSDIFYCCFGIEGIDDDSPTSTTRAEVLDMMFGAFGIIGVAEIPDTAVPQTIELHPPYPNPFNSQVLLAYSLPHPGRLSISIYDVSGRLVLSERLQAANAGPGHWIWSIRPQDASGIYFIRMEAFNEVRNHKIVYLK